MQDPTSSIIISPLMFAEHYQDASFIPRYILNISRTSFWKGVYKCVHRSSWSPCAIKAAKDYGAQSVEPAAFRGCIRATDINTWLVSITPSMNLRWHVKKEANELAGSFTQGCGVSLTPCRRKRKKGILMTPQELTESFCATACVGVCESTFPLMNSA